MLVIANNGKYNDLLWEQLEQGKILCVNYNDLKFNTIYFYENSLVVVLGFGVACSKTKNEFNQILRHTFENVGSFYCYDKTKPNDKVFTIYK